MSTKSPHWVVRMNHRNRAVSWLLVFAILTVHFHERGASVGLWVAMGLQFLVYPHLAYVWALRARHPLRAEIHNMLLDNACFGAWCAVLGFPLWITGLLVMSGCLNLAAFRGGRGIGRALAAVLGGVALVWLLGGVAPPAPQTSLRVSLMCLGSLTLYLAMFGHSIYQRTVQLHAARLQLRRSEMDLQSQLDAVQAMQARLTEQAHRDPLTGLYNRRYLDEVLQREVERCARVGAPVSVLLIDLDHFKQINDTHGHAMGDAVLRRVASLLMQHMRATDLCCRYGGEEFLLLLPEMGPEVAQARAERWRQLIADQAWDTDGAPLHVTLSIGVACAPRAQTPPGDLIAQADEALYRAKAAGRNQVCVAP